MSAEQMTLDIGHAQKLAQRKTAAVLMLVAGRPVSAAQAFEHNRRLLHEEALYLYWQGFRIPSDVDLSEYFGVRP